MSAHAESRNGLAHIDHRNHNRLRNRLIAGLAAGGIALGSFALFQASQNEDNSLPTQSQTAGPDLTQSPTEVQSSEQAEVQQSAEGAFTSFWVNTLNNNQNLEKYNSSIQTTVTNMDELNTQKELLLSGEKMNSVINVSYSYGFLWSDTHNDKLATVIKYAGELQIKDAQIKTDQVFNISDTDKENGIEEHKIIEIDYVERFRANYYYPKIDSSTGDYKFIPLADAKNWLTSISSNSFPEFSQWKPAVYSLEIINKNGKWERLGNDPRAIHLSAIDPSSAIIFPSADMDPTAPASCSINGFPCNRIEINPPK